MVCLGTAVLILVVSITIFFAIKLRKIYVKGKKKAESIQTLLQKELIDLETLLCPTIEDIEPPIDNIICALHSLYQTEMQKTKHCAERKAKLYSYLISLPFFEPSSGEGSSFSTSSEVCLYAVT